MLAECVNRPFLDKQANVMREVGDRFECTADRLAEINSAGYGQMAVEVEQPKPKAKPKAKQKAKSKKE